MKFFTIFTLKQISSENTDPKEPSLPVTIELSQESSDLLENVTVNKNLYSCPECDAVFHQLVQLKKHKQNHRIEDIVKKNDETRTDDLITEVEFLLEDDSIFKKKNLVSCELCPSAFSSQSKLNDHMLKHTGERPFKCPLCSKSYPVKGLNFKLLSYSTSDHD